MRKKLGSMLLAGVLAMSLLFTGCTGGTATTDTGSTGGGDTTTVASTGTIKVGVVNNPPSESGYREANVKDMEAVFSPAN